MQISSEKKGTQKWRKKLIWEPLGLHLGRVWDSSGALLGAPGRFRAIFLVFEIDLL